MIAGNSALGKGDPGSFGRQDGVRTEVNVFLCSLQFGIEGQYRIAAVRIFRKILYIFDHRGVPDDNFRCERECRDRLNLVSNFL